MRGRGPGKSVGDWVWLWRFGALVASLLLAVAACGCNDTASANDAASTNDAAPANDASAADAPTDAPAYDAPPGCEWSTYPGGLNVHSKADLALLKGFTHLNGVLTIEGCEECTDLRELRCLTEVIGESGCCFPGDPHGGLVIRDNPLLAKLTGLGNLRQVHGDFDVSNNPSLTSLEGLNSLTSVGCFRIARNESLSSLQGPDQLARVEFLGVHSNELLEDLTGLDSLGEIGWCGLSVGDNPSLSSLNGLGNLDHGDFRVEILSNDSLANLEGLSSNLTSLECVLVEANNSLVSLSGLEHLTDVPNAFCGRGQGGLRLVENPVLADLSALDQLATASGVLVWGNESLADCETCTLLGHVDSEDVGVENNLDDACTPVPDNCP